MTMFFDKIFKYIFLYDYLQELFKLKKRVGFLVISGFLAFVIFNSGTKVWLLKRFISFGLFKTTIKNNQPVNNNQVHFSFINQKGKIVDNVSLKGKVIFINFWASWCPPCKAEMPSIFNLYEKLKNDTTIEFLLINVDDDKNKAHKYLQNYNLNIPLFYEYSVLSGELASETLPTTIVINKNGNVIFRNVGIGDYDTPIFIKQLKDLTY